MVNLRSAVRCGMSMMMDSGTVVDRRFRRTCDVPNAVVVGCSRHQRTVCLHVVVALGFHCKKIYSRGFKELKKEGQL